MASQTGTSGSDTLTGADGVVDTLSGLAGNDHLLGLGAQDRLYGGAGNDTLDGGSGADRLVGGDGNDVYVVNTSSDVIIEEVDAGTDEVQSSSNYKLSSNVENLTLTGSGNLNGTGNTLSNTLSGTAGNNTLDGRSGVDLMAGADGDDTYYVDNKYDAIVENVGEGYDQVYSTVSYSLSGNIERLKLSGSNALNGSGNALDNRIVGNFVDNTLDGGAGADSLGGRAGNDVYIIDNTGDTIDEFVGEGTDVAYSSVDFKLSANVENLVLTGLSDLSGSGNGLANTLSGNTGNNTLDGRGGVDSLVGGDGDDTYVVDRSVDVVNEGANAGTDTVIVTATRYTLGDNVENLTLSSGSTPRYGTGNSLDNTLSGNSSANWLDGAGGDDYMAGGDGNDRYYVDSSQDQVVERVDEGARDTVYSSIDYSLGNHVEYLEFADSAATDNLNGSGNTLDNDIRANAGNNTLDGGAGADVMRGRAGDDVYVVDDAGDDVGEGVSRGTDTVLSSVSFALPDNVENLTLTGSWNIRGDGNVLANTLSGNTGANVLDGRGGADLMVGGDGNDIYYVKQAGDVVTEGVGGGTDTVNARIDYTLGNNVENLTLYGGSVIDGTGNSLDNTLSGNSLRNTLDGAGGTDTLIGGAGSDRYVVDSTDDVVVEQAGEGVNDRVHSSATFSLSSQVEHLYLTGSTDIDGSGNAKRNTLSGNSGSNTLDGGTGADTMAGGAGDDSYVVDNVNDTIIEGTGGGTDTIYSSVSFKVRGEADNLTLTGTADLDATGNASGNTLSGNAGANTIDGRGGADELYGGDGNDYYIVDDTGDSVTESGTSGGTADHVHSTVSFSLAADIESLKLSGGAAITGEGNATDNVITGNIQNNTLDGGGGADTLIGNAGRDVYIVDHTADVVTERSGEGQDTVQSSVDYSLSANVEHMTLTGTNDVTASGNTLNNTLSGNSGANTLDGSSGRDAMFGGAGGDTYLVDNVNDLVTEGTVAGVDSVQSSVNYSLTDNVENLTLSGSTDLNGSGNASDNTLSGTAGANTLDGSTGEDEMYGGAGDDTYVVDSTNDVVTEGTSAGGTDSVRSSVDYTLASDLEHLTLIGTADVNASGNTQGNTLSGNAGDNTLDGGTGADEMYGGDGNDFYVADSLSDVVTESNAGTTGGTADTVSSSVTFSLGDNIENLTLTGTDAIDGTGNDLANTVSGNDGANTLDGRQGADTLLGGEGDDYYVVDDTGDTVSETTNDGGTDTVSSSVDYTLSSNLENLRLTGGGDVSGEGNAANNTLSGNVGDNTLDGKGGADVMASGIGDDVYYVDDTGDTISEGFGEGEDSVFSSVTFSLATSVDHLTLTGTNDLDGSGNALDNTLSGNSGANTLDGGTGADVMDGGAGNDTFVVDDAGDVIVESTGAGGTDTVHSDIDYSLQDGLEHLTLTGALNITGSGNSADNTLSGNGGHNTLDGSTGADAMVGGSGNDTYVVDSTSDSVTDSAGNDTVVSGVTYTLGTGLEYLTLSGTTALDGTGNAAVNTLSGNANNNTLDGAVGADALYGGAGDDVYVVDDTGDSVVERAANGTDTVSASVNYTLSSNVENLTLSATTATRGVGNSLDNTISGSTNANTLDGGSGDDTLVGGTGDDTYVVEGSNDTVTENVGEGTDTVISSGDYSLGSDVENLTLTGSATSGSGNTGNNTLSGTASANTLDGGTGDDELVGGAGDDVYVIEDSNDTVTEGVGAGTDTVISSGDYTLGANLENLTLTGAATTGVGNTSVNTLSGTSGANTLDGGAGADLMVGGDGNDEYHVDSTADTVTEAAATTAGTADVVVSSIDYTLGTGLENLTLTSTAVNGEGNALANTLSGTATVNTLDGGTGSDALAGGDGDDVYLVEDTNDTVTEGVGEGTDTVISESDYSLAANVENLTLTSTATSGSGNALDNTLSGNASDNTLDGAAGADVLAGGDGNDLYLVDDTGDSVTEVGGEGSADTVSSSVTHTLGANVENLNLVATTATSGVGNSLDNTISGFSNDNTLDGAGGADTLAGGAGNDLYLVDNSGDTIVESAGEGSADEVRTTTDYTLGANVENLTLTNDAVTGVGNSDDNTISGTANNNTLDGGAGDDDLVGGAGDDYYVVDSTNDAITDSAGTDTLQSSVAWSLHASLEHLSLTGSTDIDGSGNASDNTLVGNSGDNTLDGSSGADVMVGGDGDDYYLVDDTGDTVTENIGDGTDTVSSSVTYTLGGNVENLILTGTNDLDGTGNALGNTITGTSGANTLDGGAGVDTLVGGADEDVYVVDNAGDVVTENAAEGTADRVEAAVDFSLGANLENLTLTGLGSINGTGNSAANTISGNTKNNTLDGDTGSDTLVGGDGDDTYVVEDTNDTVTEGVGEGTDLVRSSGDFSLGANVDNLTLTGGALINGSGNADDNTLSGNSVGNTLDGAAGADALFGGAGDDVYVVDDTGDTVTENASEGTDTVSATAISSFTLGSNLENLTLADTNVVTGVGNSLNNTISGNAADNTLDGGTGNDVMVGGAGEDEYYVDTTNDTVTEAGASGTADIVISTVDYSLTANVENLNLTGSAVSGSGNAEDNTISGTSGHNTLDGGTGDDVLVGGTGNDLYIIEDTNDTVTEGAGAGTDTVEIGATYSLSANLENLTLTGTADVDGSGNASVNTLSGNSGANTLDGAGGADVMAGGTGNDEYVVDDTGDTITESASAGTDVVVSSVDYTLGSNLENLTLDTNATTGVGNALSNTISGGANNNTLDGGAGNDVLVGGDGDDEYHIDSTNDTVTEALGEGTDTIVSPVTYSLGANVDNLTLTGTVAVSGSGNALDNTISGTAGDNTLDGGTGDDVLVGGAGDDYYIIEDTSDTVTEGAAAGTDTVEIGATYTLSANLENLTLTGTNDIDGTGNASVNTLSGNSGVNTLDGAAGADALIGGGGNDEYYVDNAGDVVTDSAGTADLVVSTIDYTLGADVEHLTLTGAAVTGVGNAGANTLSGTTGNNTLDGGAGNDDLVGGTGDDVYYVDTTNDTVTENVGEGTDTINAPVNYSLGADVENLTLSGSAVSGSGNALANTISGTSGDNTLDGGTGDDVLVGGGGSDYYIIEDTSDTVTEGTVAGTDTVEIGVTYSLGANVENLILTGTNDVDGSGNALVNTLSGNSGANTLDGSTGADVLVGGDDNDEYIVDNTGDTVVESAGTAAGTADTVVSSAASYTLATNVENLTLTATAADGVGNALANTISGTANANTLDGGAGADTLVGGAGDDAYVVDNASDVVTENVGEGTDTVSASMDYSLGANVENLTLTGLGNYYGSGNAEDNTINGNSGDNTLDGGTGDDTLVGAAGNDLYVVDSTNDSVSEGTSGAGADTVNASVNWSLGTDLENLNLTGTNDINASGNTVGNTLSGNSGANTLDGSSGADAMYGAGGNDVYVVDNTSDSATEGYYGTGDSTADVVNSSVDFSIGSNIETLVLTGTNSVSGTGNVLDNTISGNSGANTLDGDQGVDTLVGGTGDDVYLVDNNDVVTENVGEGTDTVRAGFNYSLGNNLESLVLTGTGSFAGSGNSANNTLSGNSGSNTLDGSTGADAMAGGTGNDTYVVDNTGDSVTEASGAGTDKVVSSAASYTLGNNVENLTLSGTNAVTGVGNSSANTISGTSVANTLEGAAGNDTLVGGDGNDVYVIEGTNDSVNESAGQGTDTVISSGNYSLGVNLENLTLTGSAVSGSGNSVANTISGNSGNNTLDGGTNDDVLVGGAGNDVYYIEDTNDTVTENVGEGTDTVISDSDYSLTANVENLTLTSTAVTGSGNALDNTLSGTTSANTLDGGTGADTMVGGNGNDLYVVDSTADAVVEYALGGTDTVSSAVDYTLTTHLENLTLTGTATTAVGSSSANTLSGNASANTLDGQGGTDVMAGGGGNDVYIVDSSTDTVTEGAAAGTDSVQSSADFSLADNIENLTLSGAMDIDGSGNSIANTISGNTGNNTLDGGGGADVMVGSTGDDYYIVDDTGDTVTETAAEGTDTVQSSVSFTLGDHLETLYLSGAGNVDGVGGTGDNYISGNSGNNTLDGAAGADTLMGGGGGDTLIGGAGNDVLIGGDGNDVFVFTDAATDDDQIFDFAQGGDDMNVVSFATDWATLSGNITVTGGNSVVDLGDGESITVLGVTGLAETDFIFS